MKLKSIDHAVRSSVSAVALVVCTWGVPALAAPLTINTSLTQLTTGAVTIKAPSLSLTAKGTGGDALSLNQTPGGTASVALTGSVATDGTTVAAALSNTAVAGTNSLAVDYTGDGLLRFAITDPTETVALGGSGRVDSDAMISAQEKPIAMTAQEAKRVLDRVINTKGIVEAAKAERLNGKIVLSAAGGVTDRTGTVGVSAAQTASGRLVAAAKSKSESRDKLRDKLNVSATSATDETAHAAATITPRGKLDAAAEGTASARVDTSAKRPATSGTVKASSQDAAQL